MTDFIKIIKHRMKEEGLRQKDLAKLTGIHEPTISNWFNYKYDPTLYPLELVAKELGLRLVLIDDETGREVKA